MTMPSAQGVLHKVTDVLREGGVVSADVEARRLLEAVTGRSRSELILHDELDESVESTAVDLARRRAAGEPLQYVTGVAGFRRLDLAVGPGVFVPRPETELVAERAMERLPQGGTVVDVGTGSGAIALSIADERPDARVIATEHFTEALEWVRRNREKTGKDVEIIEGDVLGGLPADLRGQFDVIVSNPPYVADADRSTLPPDVVEQEPHGALFGGRAGMDIIQRLTRDALDWLRPQGWLVLEIGAGQGEPVRSLLEGLGYEKVKIGVDYANWPRVAEGQRP